MCLFWNGVHRQPAGTRRRQPRGGSFRRSALYGLAVDDARVGRRPHRLGWKHCSDGRVDAVLLFVH